MKSVRIGGADRSGALAPALEAAAGGADPVEARVAAVLALRTCTTEAEFDARFADLLRQRAGLDTGAFAIPRKPGVAGRCLAAVKAALWKLLRYQHDHMAFQQSAWNAAAAAALEAERAAWRRELAALEQRVRELEDEARKRGESRSAL
jgi:hypothetical protein